VLEVRRHGRGAGHGADHLPGVQRPRGHLRVAGPVRSVAAARSVTARAASGGGARSR
jgi:hypothetical protein